MYYLPQEMEVWYIIPAIRKELANELVNTHGMTMEAAGNELGVSKAAISQYLSNKRAKSIDLPNNILAEVKISATKIRNKESKAMMEIMRLLKLCKSSKVGCLVCSKFNKGVKEHCGGMPHAYEESY